MDFNGADVTNVGTWSTRASGNLEVLARNLTFGVSSNQAARQLLFVAANIVPIAVSRRKVELAFVFVLETRLRSFEDLITKHGHGPSLEMIAERISHGGPQMVKSPRIFLGGHLTPKPKTHQGQARVLSARG
jgi:hypothetical protein